MAVEEDAPLDWHRLIGTLLTRRNRSENTELLLCRILEKYREEGVDVPYTMEDFKRDYVIEHFGKLTLEEQKQALQLLPSESLNALLSAIQHEWEQPMAADAIETAKPRKPRKEN